MNVPWDQTPIAGVADTIDRGIAEVIVAKQRGGTIGTVKLLFEPHLTRFRNLAGGLR